jgi:hypothetical protein
MAECPHCEYNKKRAHNWRVEAYRLAGHPLPEREQEPVAFVVDKFQGQNTGATMPEPQVVWTGQLKIGDKLYTTPQKRTWVGLTDEEIDGLHEEIKVRLMGTFNTKDIYRVLEAKLKERNA